MKSGKIFNDPEIIQQAIKLKKCTEKQDKKNLTSYMLKRSSSYKLKTPLDYKLNTSTSYKSNTSSNFRPKTLNKL